MKKDFSEQELVNAIDNIAKQQHIFLPLFVQAMDRAVNDLLGDDKYKYANHYGVYLNNQVDYVMDNILPDMKSKISNFIPNILKDLEMDRLFKDTDGIRK